MLKKILTLILCITLISTCIVFADDNVEAVFELSEYSDSASLLLSLGLLEPEDSVIESSEWSITRGEFLYLAVCAMNCKDAASVNSRNGNFIDVSEEYELVNYVNYAASMGYLGDDFGKVLSPNEPLTSDFAARVGTCISEREIFLGANKSYIMIAEESGFFRDVNLYDGNKISRGDSLTFLKNVLCCNAVIFDSFSADGKKVTAHIDKNATVLSKLLKIEKREGIVTSDGMTTVYGDEPGAGYISVDGKRYLSLCSNTIGFAGKYAEFYVQTDCEPEAIRYLAEKNNDILTLDADSIESYNPQTTTFSAYVAGKNKNLRIDTGAYVSYNYEPYYSTDLKPAKGIVTLIDTDDDGVYNSVLISEYENVIVDTYSASTNIIYDLKTSARNINLTYVDDFVLTDEENTTISLEDLERESVVSVFMSKSGRKVRIVASKYKQKGVLTQINKINNSCCIDENEFGFSYDVRFDKDDLSIGGEYTAYFDALGEIAYMSYDDGVLAYIVKGAKYGAFKDKIDLMVLSEETGKAEIYPLATTVKYRTPSEEISMKKEALFDNKLTYQSGENAGSIIRQMVLIKLNEKNEICNIITALPVTSYTDIRNGTYAESEYPLYNLSYLKTEWPDSLGKGSSSLTYVESIYGFNRWLIVGSGAKMFYGPDNSETDFDVEALSVKSLKYSNGNTQTNDLEFYSKDINDVSVRYFLNFQKPKSITGSTFPAVVKDIVAYYDEKTESVVDRLTLESDNGEEVYFTEDRDTIKKSKLVKDISGYSDGIRADKEQVEIGDIIQYSLSATGKINNISLVWDSTAPANLTNNYDDTMPRYGVSAVEQVTAMSEANWKPIAGNLVRKNPDSIEISVDKNTTSTPIADFNQSIQRVGAPKIVIFDYTGRKPVVTTTKDTDQLLKEDRIVMPTSYSRVYFIVAYRK